MMKDSVLRSIQVEGTFLSPVHVGWGHELDPMSFFIERDSDRHLLHVFDLASVIMGLTEDDRNRYINLLDKGTWIEIRRFLRERIDRKSATRCAITVSSEISREYESKMGDPKNQLIFQPFFRNGHNMRPVLPGSTIKGAIRTAVIDTIVEKEDLSPGRDAGENARRMESTVLGYRSMDEDPFKAIRFEDVELGVDSTTIYKVLNFSPRREKLTDLGMRHETVRSFLEGIPVQFATKISFFQGYRDRLIAGKDGRRPVVSRYLEPEFVLASCRRFYLANLQEEHERFFQHTPYEKASERLLDYTRNLKEDECLVRIGRFTQAESKSIGRFRKGKIMVRTNRGRSFMDHGTTRNLADGRYPMGWARLKFVGVQTLKLSISKKAVTVRSTVDKEYSSRIDHDKRPSNTQATQTELKALKERFEKKR